MTDVDLYYNVYNTVLSIFYIIFVDQPLKYVPTLRAIIYEIPTENKYLCYKKFADYELVIFLFQAEVLIKLRLFNYCTSP